MLIQDNLILLLPMLVPLAGAILCIFCWRAVLSQKVVALLTQLCLLASTAWLFQQVVERGILTIQIGGWPAPYGITVIADLFSCLMLTASALVGLAVVLYSFYDLDKARIRFGYYPVVLIMQMGIGGTLLTGDLFNLYVWFEILLICAFVLITIGGTKQQLEGALKYVTINLIASGLLLVGIGTVYGVAGSLNMAEIAVQARNLPHTQSLFVVASMFFIVSVGIKAAAFPLFFWLPASYHTPPIAISAIIAGLLTKVGVYVLIRLFTLIFQVEPGITNSILLCMAGFSMVIGVLGAAIQTDYRKVLSFSIVSQIGYMLMGLAIFTPLAIAGSIFFIIQNMLVKANLFLVGGAVAQERGTFSFRYLGGVYKHRPLLAGIFFVSALSLAGIPPFSGFWGKLMLARAGFESGFYTIAGIAVGASIITIIYLTRIWNQVFLKDKPADAAIALLPTQPFRGILQLPMLLLLGFILAMGVYAEPFVDFTLQAADGLLNSENYINAVLHKPQAERITP
ncbi:proton-conducting transporter membrane subunit [Pontibacter sp. SGAir0037]|uniref:proton-conducting transporter transmembrane domain-containing protein n=1 Tax=Pontibacter sp. SGAir0037 TaxID=2571030 RepID=UPI0010CD2E07|nr:proton-conducting transporter membrane subunit [Pontibacter sp. SGAir0037]QCR21984.1 Na+/H+ antiporter subunit D [Pontibacter sp. SGAir0037]